MELRQSRPYNTEGRKTTHDFLSLYSPAVAQQDPRSPQGGFLKTHNFLQPLEQGSNNVAKEEDVIEIKDVEKPPPQAAALPSNVEHILPGGIGTYSITYFNQRFPKPEGNNMFMMAQASSNNVNDENSNCSSYTGGSGFTLWDESASAKKGKTGKENNAADRPVLRESGINVGSGEWPASLERPSQSSSNHKPNIRSFSSLSSSQPTSPPKNRGFVNMLTSAKNSQEDDDDDEEEEFTVKKEPTSHPKGNLSVKVDGRSNDQKPSTPRSKHSATEQRRRSKINDRFQKLREIIPHSDQKRDKASFLLEVIEYIQFLQEKVEKYEGPYPGWNQEAPKLMPWRNPRAGEDLGNSNHAMKLGSNPALMLPAKFEGGKVSSSPPRLINGHHLVVEPNLTNPSPFREKPESTNTTASIPMSQGPSLFPFGGSSSAPVPLSSRPVSDAEQTASQPSPQFWPRDSFTADSTITDKLKDQELAIESGTISISSIYSQGLFSKLTQALQSSGIDLSQANISVQIDLGKRANGRVNSSASIIKDMDMPSRHQAVPRSSVISTGEDCPGQALKRIKTCRS
ncbi:OLC1v1013979C1 [Oldenlandia corymbosa var. corymbosa]|uniref:OLC1v1013979C1 n=1 Tax=Oldenlandia corymbosa var. corymbosa TaxID=529605 RepID=A0AAV1E1S4_OLDCO|nr:OLC1v1013979C1 [Oldenlandia corymbosa var. corymbosa]